MEKGEEPKWKAGLICMPAIHHGRYANEGHRRRRQRHHHQAENPPTTAGPPIKQKPDADKKLAFQPQPATQIPLRWCFNPKTQ